MANKGQTMKTRSSTAHIARALTWAVKNKAWIEGPTNPIVDAVTRRYNEDNDDMLISPRTMHKLLKEVGIKCTPMNGNSGFISGRPVCTKLFIQINTLGQMVEALFRETRTPVPVALRETFAKASQEVEELLSRKKGDD